MELRKVERKKAKIRLGLTSVSGGGKTMSALLIAYGICGDWTKIGVIDTETMSADLYEDVGNFNVLVLEAPYSPERYIEAIKKCENKGMEVIIIDGISQEWEGVGGILYQCDEAGGGFQTAWKKLTPKHEMFKQAILTSTCHTITTTRRKQDYILVEEANKHGKIVQKPVKAGFKEITREGWEYELTINLEIDINHLATATKDRTRLFDGKDPFIPTVETGRLIKQWCESGAEARDELSEAVTHLLELKSVKELSAFKATLPEKVKNSDQFKTEGTKRYNDILEAEKKKLEKWSKALAGCKDVKAVENLFRGSTLEIGNDEEVIKLFKERKHALDPKNVPA